MSKIYLRLKRDISLLVPDGNWSLHTGDMKTQTDNSVKDQNATCDNNMLADGLSSDNPFRKIIHW